MTDQFASGLSAPRRDPTLPALSMSVVEKEALCRALLAELGAPYIRKQGDELIHPCIMPFKDHQDQTRNPTASLNFMKLKANCFGCGAGGGLVWFVAVCRDVSSLKARDWISSRTTGQTHTLAAILTYFDELYSPKTQPLPIPRLHPNILKPWLFIHPYLTEIRRIPEDTLKTFWVGYDRTSERVVFPHWWLGDLVGWQTRRIFQGNGPKYMMSPDFPADRTLYNYLADWDEVVVVESVMSVLSKYHLDPRIVATFGAEITDAQLRALSRFRKIIVFADNDTSGWKMTHRIGEALRGYSRIFVADNPYAADPADFDDQTYLQEKDLATPYALWTQPTTLLKWTA